jgi:hypothetical protein
MRYYQGGFHAHGFSANFWVAQEDSVTTATYKYLLSGFANMAGLSYNKLYGFSDRCLKDSP